MYDVEQANMTVINCDHKLYRKITAHIKWNHVSTTGSSFPYSSQKPSHRSVLPSHSNRPTRFINVELLCKLIRDNSQMDNVKLLVNTPVTARTCTPHFVMFRK